MPDTDHMDLLLDHVVESVRAGRPQDRSPEALGPLLGLSADGFRSRFGSDPELFAALVHHLTAGFAERIAPSGVADAQTLASYLAGSVPDDDAPVRVVPERKAAALMLLVLTSDAALAQARTIFSEWQRLLTDAAGGVVGGHLVRALLDGWWFAEAFGLAAPDPSTRAGMRAALPTLVDNALAAGRD